MAYYEATSNGVGIITPITVGDTILSTIDDKLDYLVDKNSGSTVYSTGIANLPYVSFSISGSTSASSTSTTTTVQITRSVYEKYYYLTTENFLLSATKAGVNTDGNNSGSMSLSISAYNQDTGYVTVKATISHNSNGGKTYYYSASGNIYIIVI